MRVIEHSGDATLAGRVIRAYRCHPFHRHRVSQALIAGWLHINQAAFCRIETGRRRVTIDVNPSADERPVSVCPADRLASLASC